MLKRRSALLSKTAWLGLMLLLASLLAACGDKAKSDADLVAEITADAKATAAARPGPGTPGGFTSITIKPALSPEATVAVTTASGDNSPAAKVGVTTGLAAPEINVTDIDKKVFRLSDFRNSKAVLLNFWGVD